MFVLFSKRFLILITVGICFDSEAKMARTNPVPSSYLSTDIDLEPSKKVYLTTGTAGINQPSDFLKDRFSKVAPAVQAARSASAKLNKTRSLVQAYDARSDLDKEIEVHAGLLTATLNLREATTKHLVNLSQELYQAGFPDEVVKKIESEMDRRVERMTAFIDAQDRMCRSAIAALQLLKNDWGNWHYTTQSGIQFRQRPGVYIEHIFLAHVERYNVERSVVNELEKSQY